jgi:hypothetical protein
MLTRLLALTLAIPAALSPLSPSCSSTGSTEAEVVSDNEFSRLVNQLSEDPGYFWSNNYISNETSYLHVIDELHALNLEDGAYIGVGPNQNFTYIAAVRPRLAFIVDIRRQNLIEHLIFKVLISSSETREDYLARLVSRPVSKKLGAAASLADVVDNIEATAADPAFYQEQLAFILEELSRMPDLSLSRQDLEDVRLIYRQFFRQGFDIKYDNWRSFFFPSLKEFVLETDLNDRHRNWLASEETFQYIRTMERENRIIPVVGDFAGDQALRRVGRLLESRQMAVSVFYVSNVEFYLFRQRKWNAWVDNVKRLPTTESSVFIRAYANLHRPHPSMVKDHITVTLVQNIHSFLRHARAGRYRNLWDVVTADTL